MMDNENSIVNQESEIAGVSVNADYKEDVAAIRHIYDTRQELADNMSAAGADVSDQDKICEIADKVPGMVAPQGETKIARVSKSSVVYPGDFVAYARELSPENVGVVAAGAELLDAVTLDDGRIICLFAKDGAVKIKALVYREGKIVLGADWTLESATATVKIGVAGENRIVALYSTDDGGVVDVISYDDLAPTLEYSDVWEDTPAYNIAACYGSENDVWIAYLRRGESETCAWLSKLRVTDTQVRIISRFSFGEGVCRDEYDAMFGLRVLDNTRVAVSWFTDYSAPVHWTIAYSYSDGGYFVVRKDEDALVYQGSVGRTSFAPARNGAAVIFATTIIREGDGSTASKSLVAVERWDVGDSVYDVMPTWYGAADLKYNADLSLVSASTLDDDGALVTWVRNGSAFAAIVPYDRPNEVRMPAVPLGGAQENLIPLKITRTGTLMALLRGYNGDLRVDIYRVIDVVVPTTSGGNAAGIAQAAAAAGETVEITLS